MSEHLKYFETLNDADEYIIEDVPFVGYIDEIDLVIYQTASNKMIIIDNDLPEIINKVNIVFDTLNDADGYIVLTNPWSCYIKENGQTYSTNSSVNQKIVVENNLMSFVDVWILKYNSRDELTKAYSLGTVDSYLYNSNTGEGIVIYSDIPSIGEKAFYECSNLISITIPNSVTSIGVDAFHSCSSLTSIDIPNSVTSIGVQAFWSCSSLTSVTIPNSVTSIGIGAFEYCISLTSIDIPSSITTIGYNAFLECRSLAKVNISDLAAWCNIDFNDNPLRVADHLFLNNIEIRNLVIPSGITNIKDHTFSGCLSFISVIIPDSVTSIGFASLGSCYELKLLDISSNMTTIGRLAFSACRGITSIICRAATPPTVVTGKYYGSFLDVPKSATLYVPSNSISAYRAAGGWKEFTNIQAISE